MPSATPIFEAVLFPNPPMGRSGQTALILAVAVVSTLLGVAFALAGAWPVTGFFGLDVVLVWLALRSCTRQARRSEIITLDSSGLHVERLGWGRHSGRWRFEPYWVRVGMDDPPRPDSQLLLTSHGRSLAIGQFLTPHERLELARSLGRALATQR